MTEEQRQEAAAFRTFVAGLRWRIAQTYAQSYLHEYIAAPPTGGQCRGDDVLKVFEV